MALKSRPAFFLFWQDFDGLRNTEDLGDLHDHDDDHHHHNNNHHHRTKSVPQIWYSPKEVTGTVVNLFLNLFLSPKHSPSTQEQYIKDPVEKDQLFDAIHTMPAVRDKARWAVQWMNRSASFAERLVAFAAVEGILFSGSFCVSWW